MSIFQDIYDNEINIRISTFWDGGYDLKLGDYMNGYKAATNVDHWEQVEPWFLANVLEHYPDSDFAKKYKKVML